VKAAALGLGPVLVLVLVLVKVLAEVRHILI
jgi:hypothetical protein